MSLETLNLTYGRVQVLDGALPEPLYRELHSTARRLGWQFGWNTPSNPNTRYWHFEVGGGAKVNTEDRSAVVAAHPLRVFSLYQDWLLTHLVPPDTKVLRYYLNAHTYGTDGWPHTDTDRGEELTLVLYLAPEWKPEWCGETVVFSAKGEIAAAVLPRPNRLMVFPSDRLHAPRPLSKAFEGLRMVLVVKLGPAHGGGEFFSRPREPVGDEVGHVAYLEAVASAQPHSGRTLVQHLWGTYRLLQRRGASPEACLAGLFHSVYGTSIARARAPLDREAVRARIGERAERLAWLFSNLQRPQFWSTAGGMTQFRDGSSGEISAPDRRDLVLIEQANLDEQGTLDRGRQPTAAAPAEGAGNDAQHNPG